jgi:pyruvate/2-oxoglutarate dehydrogenase complex dihydrolipoamide acyltransferase (E2) component
VRRSRNCTVEPVNKRPGHVVVTTEVAVCSFCGRPRTLRHEEHQLGTLVRTIVTCETCHRTLSSTIGVAGTAPAEPEPIATEPAAATEPDAVAPKAATVPAAKPAAQRKPAAKPAKSPAPKIRAAKKGK